MPQDGPDAMRANAARHCRLAFRERLGFLAVTTTDTKDRSMTRLRANLRPRFLGSALLATIAWTSLRPTA